MGWKEIDTQICSVARALAIFGDRWTLLIVRDSFMRIRRFSDFQKSLSITKHRLSDRLNRLVENGILRKELYDERRSRYEYRLTQKGLDLYPVMMSVIQWGDKWEADQDGSPLTFTHATCGHTIDPKLVCNHCHEEILAKEITPSPGPGIVKKRQRAEAK